MTADKPDQKDRSYGTYKTYTSSNTARVRHAEVWGLREQKYDWLNAHALQDTEWRQIAPRPEFYLFVPRDEAARERYEQFVSVTKIFPVNVMGIQTHRDKFVVDFDREALKRRIRQFRDPNVSDEMLRRTYGLKDNRDWKMVAKRKKIQEDDEWEEKIVRCLYRPFDERWLFYHPDAIDFGREAVMRHMLAGVNLCLNAMRQTKAKSWRQALVSDRVTPAVYVEIKDGCNAFPLYLYPGSDLFAHLDSSVRSPNLEPRLVEALAAAYGRRPKPEEIFFYVYAVLYSESYREKYAGFLKTDFPRVPFTADGELFRRMAGLGKRLVDLHLLKSDELDPPAARFEGEGDNRVARAKSKGFGYDAANERMRVNSAQYFAPVPEPVYEYRVGGYRVCEKWLKDRKERALSLDDIRAYCRIVTALEKTIDAQEEIDALYPSVERKVVDLGS